MTAPGPERATRADRRLKQASSSSAVMCQSVKLPWPRPASDGARAPVTPTDRLAATAVAVYHGISALSQRLQAQCLTDRPVGVTAAAAAAAAGTACPASASVTVMIAAPPRVPTNRCYFKLVVTVADASESSWHPAAPWQVVTACGPDDRVEAPKCWQPLQYAIGEHCAALQRRAPWQMQIMLTARRGGPAERLEASTQRLRHPASRACPSDSWAGAAWQMWCAAACYYSWRSRAGVCHQCALTAASACRPAASPPPPPPPAAAAADSPA
ncbi:hypothetical protein JKP88DRAFT_250184 [Tribonema minus]|uniref:Uncharacterized protein n=1 Tax=Tribonema minus TaxID=303371 RepID=A0A835YJ50_9STRA|nr:hypothetical protein JKP88DRAFT_250184 [Tribonema minus]